MSPPELNLGNLSPKKIQFLDVGLMLYKDEDLSILEQTKYMAA